ncbi:hypothetical protein EDD18DRAFT_1356182 [Armillaria luteobubalina]|uniref:JmjC domain-containing protein n=1 Tax=Armillaria luteobubalina TaxID=153913 RepID=A0AA39Q015_9AGAR|nr:hypothetical protein EDD18DRAFT_1356182 [Armillaria luteobubalina]
MFCLVATKGAISYIHTDCHGVGMVVEVICGRKLWYIFHHWGSSPQDSRIDEYMGDWDPGFIPSPDKWDAEVVLLEPGSAFYMRPDTHHAVITLENSIIKGHHFYATATLTKSVAGWVHTCMLEYRIVNILHLELHELLLCMSCYFYMIMKGNEGSNDLEIPGISKDGLLDIIALQNFCIFSSALLHCLQENTEASKPAISMAITAYLSLIQQLAARYRLIFLAGDDKASAKGDNAQQLSICAQAMDIGDFTESSAAHFARSLIYYSCMAIKLREAVGENPATLFGLDDFEMDIKSSLHTFLHMELTEEFFNAYKKEKIKCLHVCPLFLVRKKEEIFNPATYTDWKLIHNNETTEETIHCIKKGNADGFKDFSEVDSMSELGSELMDISDIEKKLSEDSDNNSASEYGP